MFEDVLQRILWGRARLIGRGGVIGQILDGFEGVSVFGGWRGREPEWGKQGDPLELITALYSARTM